MAASGRQALSSASHQTGYFKVY